MKLGAVVLAAGLSRRYGKNKLLVDIGNRPMVGAAIDAVCALDGAQIAAVVSDPAVAAYAKARGVFVIANSQPELGQAHSIVLGTAEMQTMDALLFIAGDMPGITGESLRGLVSAFSGGGKGIACLQDETHFGNPALFSAAYFGELLALRGDCGAKRILRAHENDVLRVDCVYPGELADADDPQKLAQILAGAEGKIRK